MQFLWGMLIAALISGAAYRLKMLSRSGALAALVLGGLVFGLGGWGWSAVLVAFFASSSTLTRFLGKRKQNLESTAAKGGQRDAAQVLANGGWAGLAVVGHVIWPGQEWPWIAFCGSLAAANADTWATELGVLSRSMPRLITSLRRVPPGTSGAISATGSLAAVGGAFLIAILGWLCWPGQALMPLDGAVYAPLALAPAVKLVVGLLVAGLVGSLIDSLLGATCQAVYTCPTCKTETEQHPRHRCGTPTRHLRGWRWMNNDGVNGVCTLAGGLVALALWLI